MTVMNHATQNGPAKGGPIPFTYEDKQRLQFVPTGGGLILSLCLLTVLLIGLMASI